jgi:ABC-2 type transport system ATP-binding protein
MSTVALEVRNLSKRYTSRRIISKRTVQALSNVSFDMISGSINGIIGPNGSGKTTLIKTILAIVIADAGQISVFGESPFNPNIRCRIGYLPERMLPPEHLSPYEYLEWVCRMKALKTSRHAMVMSILERVGMATERNALIHGFSKGMKQRIGIAAALIGAPDLIILDEPADGIDPLGRIMVRELLREERTRGACILLNSHILSDLERICDTIGIMSNGVLRAFCSYRTLTESEEKRQKWEIRIRGNTTGVRQAGFMPGNETGEWLFYGDETMLNTSLKTIIADGATINHLQKHSSELEDALRSILKA